MSQNTIKLFNEHFYLETTQRAFIYSCICFSFEVLQERKGNKKQMTKTHFNI